MVNATPPPLDPWESDEVPIVQETVWAWGSVWTGAENFSSTWIRSPDPPTRSESLYKTSVTLPFCCWSLCHRWSALEHLPLSARTCWLIVQGSLPSSHIKSFLSFLRSSYNNSLLFCHGLYDGLSLPGFAVFPRPAGLRFALKYCGFLQSGLGLCSPAFKKKWSRLQ